MLKIIKKRLHFDVNPTNGKHVQNCEETFNLDVGKSITSNGNSPKKGTSPPPDITNYLSASRFTPSLFPSGPFLDNLISFFTAGFSFQYV